MKNHLLPVILSKVLTAASVAIRDNKIEIG